MLRGGLHATSGLRTGGLCYTLLLSARVAGSMTFAGPEAAAPRPEPVVLHSRVDALQPKLDQSRADVTQLQAGSRCHVGQRADDESVAGAASCFDAGSAP